MTTRVEGSRWPSGAPYALCLTHDVDRVHKQIYHYIVYSRGRGVKGWTQQLRSFRMRLAGREPYWNFAEIQRLEDRLGVRSSFLFLNESARGASPKFWGRYDIAAPELGQVIRDLHSNGWEIGLHGSFHSYRDSALLRREKDVLEDILGARVRSTRQHYLNLLEPETWQIQARVGLEVDSTVGFADRLWDPARGVLPYPPGGTNLLELPITLMDTIGLERADVARSALALCERIAAAGGLVVLDWHQRTFTPGDFPEAVTVYESIIRRALADGAWIATMAEVRDRWLE